MKALPTAVFAKMTSATTLYTDIGGRLYYGEAPAGAEYPYVTFNDYSSLPEYPYSKTIEKIYYDFNIFSSAAGRTEIEDILTHLRTLYDDCTLTVTGYTLIFFIREAVQKMREEHTTPSGTVGVWHYSQEYSVQIVK